MAHYAQLTLSQRYQIQALHQQQLLQKDIASQVGVSTATISRELTRNRLADSTQPYQAQTAQQYTKHRRQRQAYKFKDTLKKEVLKRLRERFSPEQISGVLALETGEKCISHETIYHYCYTHNDTDGQPLTRFLRIRHKKRYKKRGTPQKRGTIPHRVGIEERPAIVQTNTQLGHWEGDTIIGAEHDGVLLTLVERVTKYTIIVKLPSKEALFLAHQAVIHLKKCPLPVHSITFDNGKEFTEHRLISRGVEAPVYFARPYHSWERGLNENTNGLIRQYIPKGCKISIVRPSDVSWIQDHGTGHPA